MKSKNVFWGIAITLLLCLFTSSKASNKNPRVLIFTKMKGYVHESVPQGSKNLRATLEKNGITVDITDKSDYFTDNGLKPYCALIFFSNSGDLFTSGQRDALKRYINTGGGFVGIHAVSVAETGWSWFVKLVGSTFKTHPWVQKATLTIVDSTHPAVAGLPARWNRSDEWFVHNEIQPKHVHVLLEVSETRWHGDDIKKDVPNGCTEPPVGSPEAIIAPHPIAWCHEYEGGRSFYTAMGHFAEYFNEPEMKTHLLSAIRWVAHLDTAVTNINKSTLPASQLLSSREPIVMTSTTFVLSKEYRRKTSRIYVYDISGKILRIKDVNGSVFDIKKEWGLPDGIYLVKGLCKN